MNILVISYHYKATAKLVSAWFPFGEHNVWLTVVQSETHAFSCGVVIWQVAFSIWTFDSTGYTGKTTQMRWERCVVMLLTMSLHVPSRLKVIECIIRSYIWFIEARGAQKVVTFQFGGICWVAHSSPLFNCEILTLSTTLFSTIFPSIACNLLTRPSLTTWVISFQP